MNVFRIPGLTLSRGGSWNSHGDQCGTAQRDERRSPAPSETRRTSYDVRFRAVCDKIYSPVANVKNQRHSTTCNMKTPKTADESAQPGRQIDTCLPCPLPLHFYMLLAMDIIHIRGHRISKGP